MSTRQAAIVTGAARGIGRGIALALAKRGFNVALNDYEPSDALDAACSAASEFGVSAVAVPGDISDLSVHDAILERADADVGPLSTLVNNAGVSVLSRGDLLDVTEESYDRCMAVNAKAMFFLSQAFAKRLLARDWHDGRFRCIVNVTSSNAGAVAVQRAEYCVSKAAAAMVSKSFAVRLGQEGISVYDIQPGLIETAMTKPVSADYQRRIDEDGLTLLPRLGQPEDIGGIVATLAGGDLPYTTGQVISADAGMLVPRF